jgi:hypothetical protein
MTKLVTEFIFQNQESGNQENQEMKKNQESENQESVTSLLMTHDS